MSTDPMNKKSYLDAVRTNGEALAAAAGLGLEVPVPSCPGWDVADLVGHVGRVYLSVSAHIEARATEMIPRTEIPDAPKGDAALPWFEACHERVLAALGDIETDEPVWSWSANKTGGFYHRRMAHETLVHRWDGENAHGATGAIDGDLATDGISELYQLFAPMLIAEGDRTVPSGSLHLHRTDGEGEWLLRLADDGMALSHEHAKGDAAVRASAADLLMLGWARLDLASVDAEVFGDRAVADAWFGLSR